MVEIKQVESYAEQQDRLRRENQSPRNRRKNGLTIIAIGACLALISSYALDNHILTYLCGTISGLGVYEYLLGRRQQ